MRIVTSETRLIECRSSLSVVRITEKLDRNDEMIAPDEVWRRLLGREPVDRKDCYWTWADRVRHKLSMALLDPANQGGDRPQAQHQCAGEMQPLR